MMLMNKKGSRVSGKPGYSTNSKGGEIARTAFTRRFQQDSGMPETIPLPDEDALERERRKRAARRTGGRTSTVLSDENRLGG